jgi:hypothetical protein
MGNSEEKGIPEASEYEGRRDKAGRPWSGPTPWELKIERWIVSQVTRISGLLMHATVWVVFMSGYALSAVVFYRWAEMSFNAFLFTDFQKPKEIIHALLISIELLILMPVPAIVGMSTFRILMHLGDNSEFDQLETKRQVYLTEQLLIGGLVTVTGTTMMDMLIVGEGSWVHFAGGAAIILTLSAFLRFSSH